MLGAVTCLPFMMAIAECTHIYRLDKDFTKLAKDKDLAEDPQVVEVVERLNRFEVPVHPRMDVYYRLLRRALRAHSRRAADSLYLTSVYRGQLENTADD